MTPKPDSLTKKFPLLVERALAEIVEIFGEDDEDNIPEWARRTAEILDKTLDRPAAEKEDLMAAAVLLQVEPEDVEETYNENIFRLVGEIHGTMGTGVQPGDNRDVVHILTASQAAADETILAEIREKGATVPLGELQEIREQFQAARFYRDRATGGDIGADALQLKELQTWRMVVESAEDALIGRKALPPLKKGARAPS
jgi:hypothetical protein